MKKLIVLFISGVGVFNASADAGYTRHCSVRLTPNFAIGLSVNREDLVRSPVFRVELEYDDMNNCSPDLQQCTEAAPTPIGASLMQDLREGTSGAIRFVGVDSVDVEGNPRREHTGFRHFIRNARFFKVGESGKGLKLKYEGKVYRMRCGPGYGRY